MTTDWSFLGFRTLWRNTRSLMHSSDEPIHRPYEGLAPATPGDATLVSSALEPHASSPAGFENLLTPHMPVLDIDYPATLVPSSTEGHFHLYLNKELTWTKYVTVLEVLAEAGLIEEGYAKCAIERGASYARLPGVIKGEDLSASDRARRACQAEAEPF